MDWTFEDFEAELKDLVPEVREKAMEIAKTLIDQNGYSKDKAIKEAIVRAEQWFFDSGA